MAKKKCTIEKPAKERTRRSGLITMSAIRRFARKVAERFEPEKIILFGSYAYGEPNYHSDVDILVVMPARNCISQACKIRLAIDSNFPMDLLVRTPEEIERCWEEEDWFLQDIVTDGKVLYEKKDGRMGKNS